LLFYIFGIGFFSGIFGSTICIICEIFVSNLISQLQGTFSQLRENKITLLGDRKKNKKILLWNSFSEQYSLDSLMKALLNSFETVMRLITFYFLINVQGKSISLKEAIIGIYLLIILQKASRTLSEAVKQHYNFEKSCNNISEFFDLSEIDFETIEVYDRNIHQNRDGVMQSQLWEETSVKLMNDFYFGINDDQSEMSAATDKISFGGTAKQAQPIRYDVLDQGIVDDEEVDLGDGNSAIIIGKFIFCNLL
jgi:hypothetical protein